MIKAMVERDKKQGISNEALSPWQKMAEGRCIVCNKKINIVADQRGPHGREIKFSCGHDIKIMPIGKPIEGQESRKSTYRYSRISLTPKPIIKTFQEGAKLNSDSEEISTVRMFVKCYRPYLTIVEKNTEQNSLVDVVAFNKNRSKLNNFQITKLLPGEFYKPLNIHGRTMQEVDKLTLIKDAINRKRNFDPNVKLQTTLLIDASPFVLNRESFSDQELQNLCNLTRESGYKEIWIVGLLDGSIFQL